MNWITTYTQDEVTKSHTRLFLQQSGQKKNEKEKRSLPRRMFAVRIPAGFHVAADGANLNMSVDYSIKETLPAMPVFIKALLQWSIDFTWRFCPIVALADLPRRLTGRCLQTGIQIHILF